MATELRNRESRSWRRKNEQIGKKRQAELIKTIPLQIPKVFPVSGSTSVWRLDCFPETLAGVGFGALHPEVQSSNSGHPKES